MPGATFNHPIARLARETATNAGGLALGCIAAASTRHRKEAVGYSRANIDGDPNAEFVDARGPGHAARHG